MKLKHILPAFLAAALTFGFTSCEDTDYETTSLSSVQVSQSYVSIPVEGGSTSITLNAKDSWSIDTVGTSKWLTVSPASGSAGQATVTFTAGSTLDSNAADLLLTCGGEKQHINVIQGLATVSTATCAEVIAGPDAKTYQVTGTVTAIANTVYGNFYVEDGTGSVYIYGTLFDGKEKNDPIKNNNIEVGDEVTVSGPKTTYGTTVELVNVTVLKVNKSLIKCDSISATELPIEGGESEFFLTCKGQGVTVDIPTDAQDWLSIKSIQSKTGEAVVTFKAAPNTGGDRSTTITFHTTDGAKDYTAQAALAQKGAIIECSIADFNAAAENDTQYRITGCITEITNEKYGNVRISDGMGSCLVYATTEFKEAGWKVGDIVTLVGKRTSDKSGNSQIRYITLEGIQSVETVTVEEFLAKETGDQLYRLTGNIANVVNTTYGNFDIVDATGSVYIYGLLTGINGERKQYESLGLNEGDNITLITKRAEYNGAAQGSNAWFISKNAAE